MKIYHMFAATILYHTIEIIWFKFVCKIDSNMI